MAIRVKRHANVSKQTTLLDGVDVFPLKWRVCGCGLNSFVHEGMNHISNVEVHLKTRNGNVNIMQWLPRFLSLFCNEFQFNLHYRGCGARRPIFGACKQQMFRPAGASAQTDQRLCYW